MVDAAVTVRVEDPAVLIELALKVAESPGTSEMPSRVRFAVVEKFNGIRLKVNEVLAPGLTVAEGLLMVNQKSVPVGVSWQAPPGLPWGNANFEVKSANVSPRHPAKLSVDLFLGVGTMNSVSAFTGFHHVLFDETSVFSKLVQSEPPK